MLGKELRNKNLQLQCEGVPDFLSLKSLDNPPTPLGLHPALALPVLSDLDPSPTQGEPEPPGCPQPHSTTTDRIGSAPALGQPAPPTSLPTATSP